MTVVGTPPPAPPPGPGLQPPFVAPPTDGTTQRRWVAAGLVAATVLVCCLGGILGIGSLVVLGNRVIHQQAEQAVTDFLTAVSREQYATAYGLVCDSVRDSVPLADFQDSISGEGRIASFTVGSAQVGQTGVTVPATLYLADGTTATHHYELEQIQGGFRVCGETG